MAEFKDRLPRSRDEGTLIGVTLSPHDATRLKALVEKLRRKGYRATRASVCRSIIQEQLDKEEP